MGEEAGEDYELELLGGGEEDRVMEWETGLPGADELTPLSQSLVPAGLAAAFRIPPEPGRTLLDVHRASEATVSRLRRASSTSSSSFPSFQQQEADSTGMNRQQQQQQKEQKEQQQREEGSNKRPRLVWTPQLHKRFVDVVAHLGIKNAVPKTIMQLMNVEGLTRENVASHLQKYRLYVKRMQGLSNEGPSPSDHIFASTPVPHSLVHEPTQVAPTMYHHGGGMVPIAFNHPQTYYSNGNGNGGGYSNGHSSSSYYHHHQQQYK